MLVCLVAPALSAQVPRAIFTDPPRDTLHPARMQVLHIPSGGVKINGVAFIAQGAGPHPTVLLLHGWPGNEKNLDLAQAIRRAGWNVITFNYRGSWGSPGDFRFANNLEDAESVLAFMRDTATVRALNIDLRRVVMAGHSMGGWVTALTASHHPELSGAILISAADMGASGARPREEVVKSAAGNMESLAGVTAESMADELIAGNARWGFDGLAKSFARMPLLVLTANDGLAPHVEPLVKQVRALGNTRVTTVHAPTDHSWSDKRILLESTVITWLQKLEAVRR